MFGSEMYSYPWEVILPVKHKLHQHDVAEQCARRWVSQARALKMYGAEKALRVRECVRTFVYLKKTCVFACNRDGGCLYVRENVCMCQ